jgi:hypothetical protein
MFTVRVLTLLILDREQFFSIKATFILTVFNVVKIARVDVDLRSIIYFLTVRLGILIRRSFVSINVN